MSWLKIVWGLITGNSGTIVSAVVGTVGKLSDNATARVNTALGAERDVQVEQLKTVASAWHDRASLLAGLRITQWLIAAALIPPLWHQGLIYLDSCPYLPGIGDAFPGLWIWPHDVGSWRVPRAPPPYDDREWSMIASLLGIQTGVIAAGSLLRWLHK